MEVVVRLDEVFVDEVNSEEEVDVVLIEERDVKVLLLELAAEVAEEADEIELVVETEFELVVSCCVLVVVLELLTLTR